MDDATVARWTALIGIVTVILAIVPFAIFGALSPPSDNDPGAVVAKFFADNRTVLAILIYTVSLSFGLNLAFFVGLRDVLRRRAPGIETLATVGALGGALFIAVVFVGFGVLLQLVYREGAGDPATQRTLLDIYTLNVNMAGVPTAVALSATSIAVLRSRVFPAWIAWYGLLVAVVHLVGTGSLARDGFFAPSVIGGLIAPILFYIWVLAFSLLLLRPASGAEGARA